MTAMRSPLSSFGHLSIWIVCSRTTRRFGSMKNPQTRHATIKARMIPSAIVIRFFQDGRMLLTFGVRRQSEAATALWSGYLRVVNQSGVALRLPPHSKVRLRWENIHANADPPASQYHHAQPIHPAGSVSCARRSPTGLDTTSDAVQLESLRHRCPRRVQSASRLTKENPSAN